MEEQKMKAPSGGQKSHGFAILLWIERNFFRNSQVPQKVIFDDLILTFLKWLSVIRDKSIIIFCLTSEKHLQK